MDRAQEPLAPGAWRRLGACTLAAALLQLDGTLITVALPSVARGLRVSGASTSIVLSTYFAAYAVALLPAGVLVDRLGARRLALVGLAVFALGAASGAAAASLPSLLAARVVQGVGAGLVSPAALAGAVSGFPPERRGSALGTWGAAAGVSNLLGPLLGGLLTVALGWRADWWALVPLSAVAAAAIAAEVPAVLHSERAESTPARVDGVVVAAAGVAALTFAVMIGSFYLAEQYLQRSAGYSALRASAVLVVIALMVGGAAPFAGRLVDRHGERLVAVSGFLLAGAGLAVLALPGVPLDSPAAIAPLVPVGVGLGLLFVPTSRAALNATPPARHGRTSALLSIGRLLGAAVGAGLAGVALSGGADAATVHQALLIAAVVCALLGCPVSARLVAVPAAAPREIG